MTYPKLRKYWTPLTMQELETNSQLKQAYVTITAICGFHKIRSDLVTILCYSVSQNILPKMSMTIIMDIIHHLGFIQTQHFRNWMFLSSGIKKGEEGRLGSFE
jgi:hypothetical protein